MKTIRRKELVVRNFWTLAIALFKTCSFKDITSFSRTVVLVLFPFILCDGFFFLNWFTGALIPVFIAYIAYVTIQTVIPIWFGELDKRRWKFAKALIAKGKYTTILYFPPSTPCGAVRSALRGQFAVVTHISGF